MTFAEPENGFTIDPSSVFGVQFLLGYLHFLYSCQPEHGIILDSGGC